jgi:hypothetical protein
MANESAVERISSLLLKSIRDPLRARQHLHEYRYARDRRLIRDLRLFAPGSAGHPRDLARLTVQSAAQTPTLLAQVVEASGRPLLQQVDAQDFCDRHDGQSRAAELGSLFDKYGSDKTRHGYHFIYGSILKERGGGAPVVEVGIGTNNEDVPSNMGRGGKPGASLRAFRDYLPNAAICGADIDSRILFLEERINTVWVDQTDNSSFGELRGCAEGFRLLIDDGLHSPNANLAVLLFGLPLLRPGSWIVIEDIVPDALPLWQLVGVLLGEKFATYLVRTKTALVYCVTPQVQRD